MTPNAYFMVFLWKNSIHVETEHINQLKSLFTKWSGSQPDQMELLPQSGSYRAYCRMKQGTKSVLGVHNLDEKENRAFISFTQSFLKAGLQVPQLYAIDLEHHIYLVEDFGPSTLFDVVSASIPQGQKQPVFDDHLIDLYKKSLSGLIALQLEGKDCIDYAVCYPRAAFDRQSMMWDLNYFKYYFLKLVRIPFDEQALEDDFTAFVEYLTAAPSDYFLFRDFQSANIVVKESDPYYIDYQGGRRGALQYDPASLLYDAKARLPKKLRRDLIEYYVSELQQKISVDTAQFMDYYQGFVLIRLMQALGAFGFRGLIENKPGFTQSIPPAVDMLSDLLDDWTFSVEMPQLKACFQHIVESTYIKQLDV